MTRLVVIGATGDVGAGIVAEALDRRWDVVGVGRTVEKLTVLAGEMKASERLTTVAGSVATEHDAALLVDAVNLGEDDCVVTTVNAAWPPCPLLDTTASQITAMLSDNLLPHFVAAKAILPVLSAGSVYLGIGGGMADFVVPGRAPVSMAQAAQRAMFRSLARENRDRGVYVRELMVASMVNGRSNRATAPIDWITDRQVGKHVCEIIEDPDSFAGPIITVPQRS